MNHHLSRRAIALTVLLTGLFAGTARADSVTLINGDRLTGTVNSIAGGSLSFSTAYGDLAIPMAEVASVQQDAPMNVTTATGSEISGALGLQNGEQVITTDSGIRRVALTDLAEVVAPYTGPVWSTTVDLGYVLTKGNSDTESRLLHINSQLVQEKFEHRAHAYWDTDESEDETTRDTLDAGYGLRYYFRDKWYALGTIGYFQDDLKDIDSRWTIGAGVGYQFFDNALASLSTDLGITMVFEDLDGDSESNPALRWGVDYLRWLSPEKVEYFYGHEVLKILDSDRGEIYKANTGVRFHLTDRWHANARVDLVHETEPPEGSHRTDLTYSVGFGLVF